VQLDGLHSFKERRFTGSFEDLPNFVPVQSLAHNPFVKMTNLLVLLHFLTQSTGSFDQLVTHLEKQGLSSTSS
jgi:hypothetical protein